MVTISTASNLHIKELKPWLEKETLTIVQPLNEQGKKIVDKLRERLKDTRESCEKLAEEGRNEAERGKAVRKAKATDKLSRYFLKQIDKIMFPDKLSFSDLERLNRDLEKTLSTIARERSMWFPRISPLFIIARKKFDFAFSRLAGSISELGDFLKGDYTEAKLIEKLALDAEEIERLIDDLSGFEGRKAAIEERVQFFQSKIFESKQDIESAKSGGELDELAEASQKVQKLRSQVKHSIRHLEKPFMKFANLSRGPGYALTSEELEKLGHYLEDPFKALATESTGYPVLKGILGKVKRAMDEGKLKLKSSRLRKAQEEIEAVMGKNALADLQQECVQAFSANEQLVSSGEAQAARRQLKVLQRRLDELHKRKEATTVRLEGLEKEHNHILMKVKEQKKSLEDLLYKVLGRQVVIQL